MRLRHLLFCVVILFPLAQGCGIPQIAYVDQAPSGQPVSAKVVTEKKDNKIESLTADMTKAEVEAILGQPTRCLLGGGSLSSCEQYAYTYQGEDGLAFITFSKNAGKKMYWGEPGMQDRINTITIYRHPQATQN